MEALTRLSGMGLAVSGLLLFGTAGALAHGPIALTDRQLDRVSAGGVAFMASNVDASAAGALALTETSSQSLILNQASPYPHQPGLGSGGGFAEGVSVAMANNLWMQGQPPPATATSVQTGGAAVGNYVTTTGINYTVQGAGGIVVQAGWTFVYGAWMGL